MALFGLWEKVVIEFTLEHGKIIISVGVGTLIRALRGLPTPTEIAFETLSNIVGAFKTTAASRINKLRGVIAVPVWQKSFYDRIVRDEQELECIQKYIQHNPVKWAEDRENPCSSKYAPPARSVDDYWNEIFNP